MSAPNKTSRLGRSGGAYQRPSADVLDDLTNSGTSGTTDVVGTQDDAVSSDTTGTPETHSNSDTKGVSGTSGTKTAATPRDHVKVSRPLVNEMRDAVWFLSEHGRPRVQLGELLDEAIGAWLTEAKAERNGGEPFPVRGRLR